MLCLAPILAVSLAASPVRFERSDLSLAQAPADLMYGDLDGDGRSEVIALGPGHRVCVYPQRPDGRFASADRYDASLRDDTWAVCLADVLPSPGNELLQLTSAGVWASAIRSSHPKGRPQRLVAFGDPLLPHDRTGRVSTWRFAEDLDGDGLPELIVPAPPKLLLFKRDREGRYHMAHTLDTGRPVEASLGSTPCGVSLLDPPPTAGPRLRAGVRADMGAIVAFDHDRDGQTDVAVADKVFVRQPDGAYQRTELPPRRASRGRHFYAVDVNGDGVQDQAQASFHRSLTRAPVTSIRIRLLDKSEEAEPTAKYSVRLRGVPYWRRAFVDVDGDGKLDLVMLTLKDGSRSLGSIVERALVSGFEYDLRFYLFRPGKGYATRPDLVRSFRVRLDESIGTFPQADVRCDLNADGLKDVFIRRHSTLDIAFLRGIRQGYPVGPDAQLPLPKDVNQITWRSLNSDDVSDPIIVHHHWQRLRIYVSNNP